MISRVFSERQPYVAMVAFAAVVLQGTAGLAFAAVYGFDVARHADLGALTERGPGTATAFRLALLIDMLGYLAVAPVVLHLHRRLHSRGMASPTERWLVDVVTFFGLLFTIAGSIGATVLAVAGSTLIDAAAGGGPSETAARVGFEAVSRTVNEGLWGPLEFLAAGIWVGGVGGLLRNEARRFAATAMVVAAGLILYAARTGLTGRNPVESVEAIDLVALAAITLFALWELWLAARLWLGR